MSLASMGLADASGRAEGRRSFCARRCGADGSWPIDTNLATWVTTLAIKALAHQPGALSPEQRLTLREWLLGQQYRVEHPYTHAAPGGWAWTDLPGGVPDADDTPGALLALLELGTVDDETRAAGDRGRALAARSAESRRRHPDLLPRLGRAALRSQFARSHRAHAARVERVAAAARRRLQRAHDCGRSRAALRFLAKTQRADGSWLPLWFGNEHAPDDENPLYGTAQVVHRAARIARARHSTFRAAMLTRRRCAGWSPRRMTMAAGAGCAAGRHQSEETALAVEALAGTSRGRGGGCGARWLVGAGGIRRVARARADRVLLREALVLRAALSADLHGRRAREISRPAARRERAAGGLTALSSSLRPSF